MKQSKTLLLVERIALGLFLVCMLATAAMFIVFVWTQPTAEALYGSMATVFVVGFASFLIWLPIILYNLLRK